MVHLPVWRIAQLVLLGTFVLSGCGPELETGYKYRPLGATVAQRRGYYASPYSAEKAAAQQDEKQGGPKLGTSQ